MTFSTNPKSRCSQFTEFISSFLFFLSFLAPPFLFHTLTSFNKVHEHTGKVGQGPVKLSDLIGQSSVSNEDAVSARSSHSSA